MRQSEEVISTLKHPAVLRAREALGQVGRAGATAYIADGRRLVSQAVDASAPVEGLCFLHPIEEEADAALRANAGRAGLPCHLVTRGVFFRILGLGYETSVGVLAVIRRPAHVRPPVEVSDGQCLLVGEQIQDPRNVGVLVRTADAWGLAGVVFTDDSADPYSRGAVRSSTGSIFRLPPAGVADLPGYLRRLSAAGVRAIGTSVRATTPCWSADLRGACALVLGNETEGISQEVREACDVMVRIPMPGSAHSFNVTVAAGILLYERERQGRGPQAG